MVASTFIENGTLDLKLNNQIILSGSGKVSINLKKGDHELTWIAKGELGTSFTISISSPAHIAYHLNKVITQQKSEMHIIEFKI